MKSSSKDVTWRERVRQSILGKNAEPIPTGILSVIFAVQVFNSMTTTSVMSYSPQLINFFGYSEVDTGYYAGLLCASVYYARIIFCIQWGLFMDWQGMKFSLMTTTLGLSISILAFGFSFNFYWAFFARLSQGIFCGVIVASKSIILTYCHETNVAFGMTLLGAGFAMGMVLGPSVAGLMVFPVQQYPTIFQEGGIFSKFPVLLPNLVISFGLFICLFFIKIYIPEDNNKKAGLLAKESYNSPQTHSYDVDENLTKLSYIEEIIIHMKQSKLVRLLRSYNCLKACLLFVSHGILSYGYNEIFPVYLATIRKYYGLQFTVHDISILLIITAVLQFFLQIIIIPPLCNRLGHISYQIFVNNTQAILYPLIPMIGLMTNQYLAWVLMIILTLAIRLGNESFFININIILKNSIGLDLMGSANGLSMTVSAIGSSIGTSLLGLTYSWSLANIKGVRSNVHPLGFPFNQFFTFLLMSVISLLTAIYVSRLRHLDYKPQISGKKDKLLEEDIP